MKTYLIVSVAVFAVITLYGVYTGQFDAMLAK